ncbi:MAG: carboxypeptidase-like regulatory domain-containing protein [Saprospiraceae bacterium]|nr:carboxypeptidase-like regulatory domain-containing protein [Saprospiraceae bacterium]
MLKWLLPNIWLVCTVSVMGQVSSSLKGWVRDVIDDTTIGGVRIELLNDDFSQIRISDDQGFFHFQEVPAGYYRLAFSSLGYQSKTVASVEVHTGVPLAGSYYLSPASERLPELVVQAESRKGTREALTSVHTLTTAESFRFPATFYDPARLTTLYAGVVNPNDQANNLVIRGNTPNGVRWHLQDVEIVNPNHLSNAGTFSDRSTQSGGGVNILSAQMLDNSLFMKGAFPTPYGNATAGILDMQLRQGASDKLHGTGQIGLIGIDAALEGPIANKSAFLVNYRYSTLGILSAMGVDLGDEAISFQDLSFHVSFSFNGNSELSFFGLGGFSDTEFIGSRDTSVWLEFKDRQDILFVSRMGAVGAKYKVGNWKTSLIYSGFRHKRNSEIIDRLLRPIAFEKDLNRESKLGIHSSYRAGLGEKTLIDIGLKGTYNDLSVFSSHAQLDYLSDVSAKGWLYEGYGDLRWQPNVDLALHTGLHVSYFTLNKTSTIEPRISARYNTSASSYVGLSYGLYSRTPESNVMLLLRPDGRSNNQLDFIRSHHAVLSYTLFLDTQSKIVTEVFYQHLFNIPTAVGKGRSLATINSTEFLFSEHLQSKGTGDNYGVEVSYQKYFEGSTFFEINGTLYDSKYTGDDGRRRNTRYNGKYGFNISGGKEFSKDRRDKRKSFGVNLRLTIHGGFWEGPIDVAASRERLTTVYEEVDAFTEQLPAFFKADVRIYFKRTKEKYSSIFGLDLLNATNRTNIDYYFFDPHTEGIMAKDQLGIIPNLSYRIEF